MGIENLNSEVLKEKFENFLFNIDNYIESLQIKAERKSIYLDMSLTSLYSVVKAFILRKKENLFITAIKSQVNPVKIDWSKFPTED